VLILIEREEGKRSLADARKGILPYPGRPKKKNKKEALTQRLGSKKKETNLIRVYQLVDNRRKRIASPAAGWPG